MNIAQRSEYCDTVISKFYFYIYKRTFLMPHETQTKQTASTEKEQRCEVIPIFNKKLDFQLKS